VNGWILGYLVGAVVVAVVVIVLLLLVTGARRTALKAEAIAESLRVARDRSLALGSLDDTAAATQRVTTAARAARTALVERSRT
jgi:uncharacterized membrane protein